MAKQRYIKDSFWTDPYIEKLSPDFKLVFLYLLTNPLANIAGVYEIRPKRIAYETGYDQEVIDNILKKFQKDEKIILINDWLILINHFKHQSLGNLTAEGINRIIEDTPEDVKTLFSKQIMTNSKGEEYPVYMLKDIPLTRGIQAPTYGAYSEVKLSKVIYNIYGEFKNVKLKDEEYKKLEERFGKHRTDELIEELSTYMASKGKRYSSHYATLLNWGKKKAGEKNYKSKNITTI